MSKPITDVLKSLARARGLQLFEPGDPAVMVYQHKGRSYRKQVEILEVHWDGAVEEPETIEYTVRSEHGGVFTLSGLGLRPGTAIDRIVLALEISDKADAEEAADPPPN